MRTLIIVLIIWALHCACEVSKLTQTTSRQSVSVRIVDEHGNPTPCRVRFAGLDSVYYAPDGHEVNFTISQFGGDVFLDNNRRFAYVNGLFTIQLPQTDVIMEVIKGYDYRMVADTVNITPETKMLEIRLEKWFEFPDRPWYSGDIHVHLINPATALLESKAENLNVTNILVTDCFPDQENFLGAPDPLSEPNNIIYVNQEYREDRLGHIILLNLKRLMEPVVPMRPWQYPLNIEACDFTHAQGGHVAWAHFVQRMGIEWSLDMVLKKINSVELLCNMMPFHEAQRQGDVIPEWQCNSGLRLWYRLLNCGLKISATAGTDKMNNWVTVGGNRVFAKVEGDFTYQHWIEALNEGRTFVSNSPFLFLEVDGKGPGETVHLSAGKSIEIKAEVWSQLPLDRLELIANGEIIAERIIAPGEEHARLSLIYTPEMSVWITARAYEFYAEDKENGVSFATPRFRGGGPTLFNSYYGTILPEVTFAHTSPVYVLRGGHSISSRKDAEYLARHIDNSIAWLRTQGKFPSEEAKRSVLETFEQGRQEFLKDN